MNSVSLVGRLVADPNTKYTSESQMAVTTFRLAVDRTGKGGDKTADFIPCKAFGKQAEMCEKYLTKGRLVSIEGSINTYTYQDKEGKTNYSWEVIARNVQFLDKPKAERAEEAKPEARQMDFTQVEEDVPF